MPAVKRSVPAEDAIPRVLEVLNLIVISMNDHGKKNRKKFQDIYSLCASTETSPPKVNSFGRQCIDLAMASISSHRFEDAAKLLWIISQDRCTFETFLYKASMIILENLNLNDESGTAYEFFSKTLKLIEVNKMDVKLEYLIYSLEHNVLNIQKSLKDSIPKKPKSESKKNCELDSIFHAYSTLLDYIKWYKDHLGEIQSSQNENVPENSITSFKKLVEKPGQWDIFVLKLIKMLEFSNRSEEIEDVLVKYIECNPEHINAYIYLSVYLHEHDPESPNFIKYLKVLAELCPSDVRVLFLVEKWINSGDEVKMCLKYLFMFLDYPSNGKNIQAWKMLSRLSHQITSGNEDSMLSVIESCWKSRRRSWNMIYFNPAQICFSEDLELMAYKVDVLSKLECDHIFNKEMLEKLPAIKELLPMERNRNQLFITS